MPAPRPPASTMDPVSRRPPTHTADRGATFESEVRAALERFRTAARELVVPALGKHDVRAADLVEAFGIDNRLAWKFVKILTADDLLAAVKYLPGERGVGLFLRAAEAREAGLPAIEAARAAFASFEEFVRQEAGDRRSFNMMVTGHAAAPDEAGAAEHRRGAFEHNGYVFGVQARVQIHTYLIQPHRDGGHLDIAVIRGFVGLRRVRPNVPWRISRFYSIDQRGRVRGDFEREPLDTGCGPDGVPLLSRFCSRPTPQVRRRQGPHGITDYVLAESDVGNALSVTCLTGEVMRRAEPCHSTPEYPDLGTIVPLRTPCELVVMDVFLNRGFFGEVTPALRLLNDLFNESLGSTYIEGDALPCPAESERMSAGARIPRIREFPDYAPAVLHSFERLGWDPVAFDCYRVRLPFPPVPASLIADFPLPPRPASQ